MRSQIRQHYIVKSKFLKQILHVLVKRINGIMCAKNGRNTFKFVKIIPGKLQVLFFLDTKHTHLTRTNCNICFGTSKMQITMF